MFDVRATISTVHVSKCAISPPSVESKHPLFCLILTGMPWRDVLQIDRQDVSDEDFSGMTSATPIGLVFVCEVFRDCALGADAILCSAARAD